MTITTYEQASEYLKAGRNPYDRPLPGNGTRLQRRDDNSIAVNYRGTDVVTYHPDGTYTLNRGGWNSDTTRRRIEEYSPFRLHEGAILASRQYREPIRPYTKRGPETWIMERPDRTTFEIRDGIPVT